MAKKPAAKESLQEMSVKELQAELAEAQQSSFKLRFQHATNPLKNPMVIRSARRRIAQLMTVLHAKELKKEKVA